MFLFPFFGYMNADPRSGIGVALRLCALDVLAGAGINAKLIADLDKERYLNNGIGFESSGLGGTGSGLLKDDRLLEIGEKYGKSSAQVVIRWHLQRGVIVLPKSVHNTRIQQNINVFDFELDDEDMHKISAMDTGKRNGADPNDFDF